MADLLFVWIGLNQTSKSVANVYVAMQLNPKQTHCKLHRPVTLQISATFVNTGKAILKSKTFATF